MSAGGRYLGRGPRRDFASSLLGGYPSTPATPPAPSGAPATAFLPRLIQHKAQARNGLLPEMTFARKLASALNHILAYRRKSFFTYGDYINRPVGASGTTDKFYFRCHTGYAARYITIALGIGLADTVIGTPTDPRVEILVTSVATGVTVTYTAHHGINAGGTTSDNPNQITDRTVRAAVVPNATYEVVIRVVDYARIIDACAYEEAAPNIDTSVDFFINSGGIQVGSPIYDATRARLLEGFSKVWKRNGPQLLTLPFIGNSYASTTFTNVIDDSTAVPSDATAGFWLGDGDFTLQQLARLTGNKTMNVVFAAHASMAASSPLGEVRLQDASGTRCTLTGIGQTAQWYATETTIANLDTLAKVDVQGRTTNGANAMTLNAVALYALA